MYAVQPTVGPAYSMLCAMPYYSCTGWVCPFSFGHSCMKLPVLPVAVRCGRCRPVATSLCTKLASERFSPLCAIAMTRACRSDQCVQTLVELRRQAASAPRSTPRRTRAPRHPLVGTQNHNLLALVALAIAPSCLRLMTAVTQHSLHSHTFWPL